MSVRIYIQSRIHPPPGANSISPPKLRNVREKVEISRRQTKHNFFKNTTENIIRKKWQPQQKRLHINIINAI